MRTYFAQFNKEINRLFKCCEMISCIFLTFFTKMLKLKMLLTLALDKQ